MRLRFRTPVVALLSLLAVIACSAGGDQCLNPIPDLPSCGNKHGSDFNGGGAGPVSNVPGVGGASATGSGGFGTNDSSGVPGGNNAAGSSADSAGAGGDSAIEPSVPAAGAAGSPDDLPDVASEQR